MVNSFFYQYIYLVNSYLLFEFQKKEFGIIIFYTRWKFIRYFKIFKRNFFYMLFLVTRPETFVRDS